MRTLIGWNTTCELHDIRNGALVMKMVHYIRAEPNRASSASSSCIATSHLLVWGPCYCGYPLSPLESVVCNVIQLRNRTKGLAATSCESRSCTCAMVPCNQNALHLQGSGGMQQCMQASVNVSRVRSSFRWHIEGYMGWGKVLDTSLLYRW